MSRNQYRTRAERLSNHTALVRYDYSAEPLLGSRFAKKRQQAQGP